MKKLLATVTATIASVTIVNAAPTFVSVNEAALQHQKTVLQGSTQTFLQTPQRFVTLKEGVPHLLVTQGETTIKLHLDTAPQILNDELHISIGTVAILTALSQ